MSRRVLITGASRGIGRAIALELAAAGFELALNYKSSTAAAEALAAEIAGRGGKAGLLPFDVADRAAAARAIEGDLAANGPFWGVVLNAGLTRDGLFAAMEGEAWDAVIGANLGGFFNVIRPLLMPMVRLRDGGRVVVISSVSGLVGNPGQVNYGASKAGLVGAARALAIELAARGIAVNCVAPGFVDTEMLAGLDQEKLRAMIPARRVGRPEEIAALVGFLFSERAAYLTGQTIAVDGGLSSS